MLQRARVLSRRGDYQETQKLCQQVIAALPEGEVKLQVAAHMRLGVCAAILCNFPMAISHLQKALQLGDAEANPGQVADAHATLGNVYGLMEKPALADYHKSRSMSLRQGTNDVWGKIYDLIRLGVSQKDQGMYADAEATLMRTLAESRSLHFLGGQAYSLDNLAELYQEQGFYERALKAGEEAVALARQVKDDMYLLNGLLCDLAMTYLYMGDAVTANLLIAQVELRNSARETFGDERINYELAYSTILLYQHRYDDARANLLTLTAVLDSIGMKRELLLALIRLSACYLAQNQPGNVVLYLKQFASLLATSEPYVPLVYSELRRLPLVEQAIKTFPELSQLRTLLHLEAETQEAKDTSETRLPVTQPLTAPGARQLRILALGEPAVFIREKPVTRWRMARAMELFFFLFDCDRPVRKEQILTALWSEVDEQVDRTFHSTIYYLRKVLGESCLVSKGGSYWLDLASPYGSEIWYDVARFQESYERAKQALARNDEDGAQEAFEAMITLYRGDYVQSFYSDWCRARRDELRRNYLDARHHLAHIAWRREQYDASAEHWRQMLALDDCLEEAHYGLMRYYLHAGKRGLALRQYQRYRETLQQELGVQPGPAIQGLYQRLVTTS
ncbi:MAG TPA: BTAD domain-containing putative transcriptional regulator [Ktedonobacteraceae bacterium]|nr:BTAD domain-containing putative transcriptional regulator [Ktedonobacteraceae bacterium]